jgi:hypothetical protein
VYTELAFLCNSETRQEPMNVDVGLHDESDRQELESRIPISSILSHRMRQVTQDRAL